MKPTTKNVEFVKEYAGKAKGDRMQLSYPIAAKLLKGGIIILVDVHEKEVEKVAIAKPVKSEKTTTKIRKKQ